MATGPQRACLGPATVPTGTLAWAAARDGAMSRREQLAYIRQTMLVQLGQLAGRAKAQVPSCRLERTALVSVRQPPDSPLARDVLELANQTYVWALLGHCLRCWLWGDLFAQLDAICYDPELLYVSCLLHDLALTEVHRPAEEDRVECFAVHGGQVARDLLAQWGAGPSFVEHVAEAITLHLNVHVPRDLGAEAHLLHAAAHLDVAGTRAGELSRARVSVMLRAPRR